MTTGFVAIDPEILGGTPCLRWSRLSVCAVAARYRAGEPAKSILDGYADLPEECVEAAIEYAAAHPFRENPDGRPWSSKVRAKDVA